MSQERGSVPSSRRWLPLEGVGEPGQAGDLKYRAVALGESRFLKACLPLVSGGEEGEIDWQGLAFLSQQKLGS